MKDNKRNSRDDKSKSGGRRASGTDKPKSTYGSRSVKGDFDPKKPSSQKDFKPKSTREGSSKSSAGQDFKPRTSRDSGTARTTGRDDKGHKSWEKRESAAPGYKTRAFKEGSSRTEQPENKRNYIKKDNYAIGGDKSKFSDKKRDAARSTDSRPYRKREDGKYKREDRGERVAPTTRARKSPEPKDDGLIRLNRYIANSGICSRRKADELIEAGVISVNGEVVSELGHKVDPYKDEVRYNGELLKREKKVYVILNKPKDYITTTEDPQERRTVMHLVEKASRERIYPVGRLDRNTTGLLLMTNDGELADKLSHPKNGITKIYHVELNKNLSQGDFNKIQFGLELEDGLIKPDNISYVAGASKKEIGIQIHSGKNRIVRRIFEHLGYDVVKLDRVVYGNLTKKDLPRGKWRFLEEHELIQIKHLIK
ncbi:MAG: pseudouridine synthase [Pedobacter sp.]|nr:pseudouridine synthase [Pedobacter sp.]MDQ8053568.1 pseudouridine synthase [Pedobacter sp.]